jgi:hypothetical protein
MNNKWAIPSVSRGLTLLISLGLLHLAVIVGVISSLNNPNHPAWIVAGFFFVSIFLSGVTSDFQYQSYSELKRNMVFGFLKMLTGSLLIAGAILSEGGVVLLGLGLASIFLVLGGRDVFHGAVLLNKELEERQQERRVLEREVEAAAQRARDKMNKIVQAAEKHKLEEALLADLSDSILDSDSPDKPSK